MAYPFRPARSSRAVPNSSPCLEFDQAGLVIPGRASGQRRSLELTDVQAHPMSGAADQPGRTWLRKDEPQVSTSPVLEPLAAESLWP
jgi:hypothetical protein